jgi:hypothetical protein
MTAASRMIDSAGYDDSNVRRRQIDESPDRARADRSAYVDLWLRRCSALLVAGVACTVPILALRC